MFNKKTTMGDDPFAVSQKPTNSETNALDTTIDSSRRIIASY
jgi:hypothetical protein